MDEIIFATDKLLLREGASISQISLNPEEDMDLIFEEWLNSPRADEEFWNDREVVILSE